MIATWSQNWQLAERCGLTRRGLYHHFSSKEDVFRAMIRLSNASAVMNGDKASEDALAQHASPVDVITAWLDTRFGATRRRIGSTPHGQEINDIAFRIATDIMIEVSYESNRKLSELVASMCRLGRLVLRGGFTYERIGRLIGDGARGVNQARPPIPNDEIAGRYRDVVEVILFGCAIPAPIPPSDRPIEIEEKQPVRARRAAARKPSAS